MEVNKQKFSTEDYLKFIQLYEYHKCLWNVQDSDYKNRKKRNKAYEDMKNKMNLEDINMVKKKIKIIRDTYNIEKQKIKKSYDIKGLPNRVYKPRIPWFDALDSFIYKFACKKNLKSGKSKKKISPVPEHFEEITMSSEDPKCYEKLVNISFTQEKSKEVISPVLEHFEEITMSSEDQKCYEKPINISFTQVKNIKPIDKKNANNSLLSSSNVKFNIREAEEINKTSLSIKNYHDEFYYFAMNLAQQLRQLPLKNALASQNKIQKLIARERINCEYKNNIPKNSTETYYFSSSTPSSLYNENIDNYDNNFESFNETEETKPTIKNIKIRTNNN